VAAATPLDLSPARIDAFLAATIEDAGDDLLADLASEARLACRLLATLKPTRAARMLEVGAGAGVVAAFLFEQGADLLAIEPAASGFERFEPVRVLLAERAPMPMIEPLTADQLDPATHGLYDVIFSVNVLEHMQPLEPNLDALAAVLAPGGRMIHTCPNYRVPYEPHFRIPLVPGRPALTRLVARRASRDPIWKSLNWIGAGDIVRFADRHGLELRFLPGQLAAALHRLRYDEAFARRQHGPIVTVLRLADASGLARLLARLPPAWMTPMTFVVRKAAA
jgi:2-polyprenyl-3-methyl-5-hydroxy-6-metoxy-1,4-benzoquinol methylase